jgi:hypothetical protein
MREKGEKGDAALFSPASQYLVSHGKSGGFGRFAATQPLDLARGDRVIIRTARGLEIGTVLCLASERQVQILARTSPGWIERPVEPADDEAQRRLQRLGQQMFDHARASAGRLQLAVEIVDIDMLLDGSAAIIQFLGPEAVDCTPLLHELESEFGLTVLLENLAALSPDVEDNEHGCGKPDCGQMNGGCASCSTTGGCSACGGGKVDMAAYFSHLRSKMDERMRTPLL